MSEDTGTPFGKYELLERLGAGGMAVVYRARYTAAPGVTKPVVIKRVLGHYAEAPAFVEMFIHEARISVGLNHGNIVQVFDFGQVNGEYFLAMELVEGQPLSRVLKRAQALGLAQLPAPLAVSIAVEMCKGLHHAHTRTDEKGRPLGLVHRDVSPDNVLVSYEGEVKISDFGVAKAQLAGRPETAAGMVKGKYLFLSPEQARGEALDARSDVYAVGVVLYRMLCGRLPVEGPEMEVMERIVRGQFVPPLQLNPNLDPGLAQILQNAMANSREARVRSAEVLHVQLSRWLATRAPLFPVRTLKYLMGLLYEHELTEQGRPPQLPPRFRDQVAQWGAAQRGSEPSPDSSPQVALGSEERAPDTTPGGEGPSTADVPVITTTTQRTVPSPAPEVERTATDVARVGASRSGRYLWLGAAVGVLVLGAWVLLPRRGAPPLEARPNPPDAPALVEASPPPQVAPPAQPVPPPVTPAPEEPKPAAPAEESFATRFGTEGVPARFTLEEKWHSFSTTTRSFQQPLDPAQTYAVWTSGSYTSNTPISEQDLRKGLTPGSSRSGHVYVFLEGEGVPAGERLFMASSRPRTVSGARALHAFVLVGITSERNADRDLTLYVRSNATRRVDRQKLDARRFAHQVALENRYSVRQLEPEFSYSLEIHSREGVPASTVAVLAVPGPKGRVQMSGQSSGEFRYALSPGRYTFHGARELWLSLPRWEADGEGEVDVALEKGALVHSPPPELEPWSIPEEGDY